jgi:hypothetical protein
MIRAIWLGKESLWQSVFAGHSVQVVEVAAICCSRRVMCIVILGTFMSEPSYNYSVSALAGCM